MGGGPYYVAQGGSRILDANRVDQSGADDADVANWYRDAPFILAVNIHSGGKDTVAAQYKLRFRTYSEDPFVDVGAATMVQYSSDTDLVNGASIAVGGRKCDTQGDTWQAGEEVEGVSLSDSIDLADDYETEIHFALIFASDAGQYTCEFELYDSTIGQSRGTCGATIWCKFWGGKSGGSRILNATRVDQSGADDVDVTNWTKTNDFILATNIHCDGHASFTTGFDQAYYYLQWKDITDVGAWTNMDTTGEIHYMATTDLVHDAAILVGGRKCSTQGYTWRTGFEVEGDWDSGASTFTNDNEWEIHWALDCSGADDSHQYGFRVVAQPAIGYLDECGAKITMGAGAVTRELVATITVTTLTSASDLNILRPLTSTIATTTSTNAIILGYIRELIATIATSTLTSTSDINVLRELVATSATATSANAIDVLMLRELTSTIPITTSTSAADLNILRELVATIDTVTATNAIELLITTIRELVATIATSTSTSTADLNILRELTSTLSTATSTSAVDMNVLREMLSSIPTTTLTSAASLNVLRELTSTIASTTLTSSIILGYIRELIATIAITTSTSDVDVNVLRELSSSIATATLTSAASLDVLRELVATIAATTLTSDVSVDVLRELTSTIPTTTATSISDLNVLRELTTTIDTTTLLSDIALITAVLRELSATIATTTLTSDVDLSVLRELEAVIAATTALSDIELIITTEGRVMWKVNGGFLTGLVNGGLAR